MSLAASWPRTTSISPALARSAPHAARLKSPPSPPLLYANSWPLPVPFATRESTVTATPSRRAGLQDLSRRHHSMACKPPLQVPTTPRRHANPAAMSTQHGAQVPPRRKLQTKTTEATVEAAIQRRRQQRGDDRNRDGTTPCNHNGATMSATTATQGDEQHRRR
ncbi:hypothetical protein EDB89DRAFT_1910258 [Lactarius sanguifluus]|nr:hypothetical protein EDB89DRAFT_1910258 [Lactarius sanguifluus]